MVKIDYSSIPPAQALISVHYRDHYFYIDDTEKESKRVFALLVCPFFLAGREFSKCESGVDNISWSRWAVRPVTEAFPIDYVKGPDTCLSNGYLGHSKVSMKRFIH